MNLQDQIASMVHGIKNHLQLLGPSIDVLFTNESSEVRDAGGAIETTLDEINHQLVLMLSLYRLEEASLISMEEVFLVDMLETACSRLKGVTVDIECADDITVFCDSRLITAVLGDALHNARRYCLSCIRVSGQKCDGGVNILIEDDGRGLSDSPDSKEGTGLGLELARRVAKAHRRGDNFGCVSLDHSELLGGVRFTLHVP